MIFVILIYLLLGSYFLPFFQYQIAADGTALMAIANAIKAGDFNNSVNAYWGITSSLLMVPLLFFHWSQPLIPAKITSLLIGAVGLIGFVKLTNKFSLRTEVRIGVLIVAIFMFLYFAFFTISSDLLILTLLIYYLNIVFSKDFGHKLRDGAWCGILAGLLSITKEYFIYFFLLHFSLITGITYFYSAKEIRKKLIKSFLVGILILIVISASWGAILTYKYHSFMFGSRGSFNFKLYSPRFPDYPMFTQGLIKPPDPYGYSAWDEPTLLRFPNEGSVETKTYLEFIKNTINKNLGVLVETYVSYSILVIPVIIITLLYLIYFRNQIKTRDRVLFYSLLTFLIFPLGYIGLNIEARYLWVNNILALLMGGYLLTYLSSRIPSLILRFLFLLLFIFLFFKPPFNFLTHNKYLDHTFYDQSKVLKKIGVVNKNIVSNTNWHQTLYLSVYNQDKYYGLFKPGEKYEDKTQELKSNNIDYYFSWDDDSDLDKFNKDFQKIDQTEISNLRVFKLTNTSF